MKTLKDFKGRIQVGTKLDSELYWWGEYPAGSGNKRWVKRNEHKGREVSVKISMSFALATPDGDGNMVNSWVEFPKRGQIEFPDADTAIITDGWTRLVFKFVN